MASSKEDIISDIDNHISKSGSSYSGWYVGISEDAKDRLFNGHDVPEEDHYWIFRTAYSSDAARDVEKHFVDKGCDGGGGGGDEDADMVYAYEKGSETSP